MEFMEIIVTGANGAVGQSILRYGERHAEEAVGFVALVRSARAAEEIKPLWKDQGSVLRVSYDDPKGLRAAFADASAVIHLPGILFESESSTYEQAHVLTTRAMVEAAKQSLIGKIVLVSATGADEASDNGFWRTKGQAEAIVRSSGLPYTILRVPILLGAGTEGAAALKRNASQKKVKLIGGGRTLQQPLFVDDLAKAALLACQPSVAKNRTLEFVGPVSLSEREMVERAGRLLGSETRISSIPKGLLRFVLTIRKLAGKRGFSVDALDVITADTQLDPLEASRELGFELTGVDEMIKHSLGLSDD
jgi:uncharacterized protein YbjT (DUF2867 family)